MRTIILLLFLLFVKSSFSQNTVKVEDTLFSIYKTEAIPYLEKFAKEKYVEKNDDLTKQLINSTYNVYIAKIMDIENKVKIELEKNENLRSSKLAISKIIEKYYEDRFVGLPKDYWDAVSKKVAELK